MNAATRWVSSSTSRVAVSVSTNTGASSESAVRPMVTVKEHRARPACPTDKHSGKTDTDDGSEQCQLRKRNQRNRLAAYFERHVETVSNCDDGKVDTGGA